MVSFIDLCSGIGAGRFGLEKNGFKCLGFSEINKDAIKTYSAFFSKNTNEKALGDLTKIDLKNIPDAGGFSLSKF